MTRIAAGFAGLVNTTRSLTPPASGMSDTTFWATTGPTEATRKAAASTVPVSTARSGRLKRNPRFVYRRILPPRFSKAPSVRFYPPAGCGKTPESSSFRGAGFAREPESMHAGSRNQRLGRCSWVPGSALKGRPGTTAEFFRSLLWFSTDAEMVGELRPGEAAREALRIERQHGGVPFVPLRDKPLVHVPVALLQIGSLHRVLRHIKQERVLEDFQVFPIAVAGRLLVVVFVA